MCYNCGCHLAHNPMGKKPVREGGHSLVEEDIELWAKKNSMTPDEVKREIKKDLTEKGDKKFITDHLLHHMSEGWGMTVDETKRNILDMLS